VVVYDDLLGPQIAGDLHCEPDHGSVVSTSFDVLEKITIPGSASYGLSNFSSFTDDWDPTA